MIAAECSTDIYLPRGFLFPFAGARVLNQLPHAREIFLADIALGKDLSDDFARIPPKQIVDDAGDGLAPHFQLTDARAVDKSTAVGPMTDDTLLFQADEQRADCGDGELARA